MVPLPAVATVTASLPSGLATVSAGWARAKGVAAQAATPRMRIRFIVVTVKAPRDRKPPAAYSERELRMGPWTPAGLTPRWTRAELHAALHPAGVHDEFLARAHGAVVGAQEQDHRRHVLGHQFARQALRLLDFHLGRVVDPQVDLALRHDPAWRHGIDADAVGAEIACQAARQADDGGLGGAVDGVAAVLGVPGHRADIDDRAAALLLHAGQDRLAGEEHGTLVDGDALVPVFQRDLFRLVALVVGGVVDEDVEVAHLRRQLGDGGLQRRDVGDVAVAVHRGRVAGRLDALDQRQAGLLCDVHEGDDRALLCVCLDNGFTDAGATARDEYALAAQAAELGQLSHSVSLIDFLILPFKPCPAHRRCGARCPAGSRRAALPAAAPAAGSGSRPGAGSA